MPALLRCREEVCVLSKTEDLILKMAEPIAARENVEIYDVEFKKEGKDWFLRVYLFSENGITIENCEAVSRALSDELDKTDPIDKAYYLEVSSPGLDRVLSRDRHFESAIGETIDIKLFEAIDGTKTISGILEKYENKTIYLKNPETEEISEIEKSKVSQARVSFEY